MSNPIGRALFPFFLTTLLAATLSAQKTLYVDNVAGSDMSSGLSSSQPKRSISSAIGLSETGDTISVVATPQRYDEIVLVKSKALVFQPTGGAPHLRRFRIEVENLPQNTIWFTGPFSIDSLDLTAGTVEGSNHLTISANGSVIRRSPEAIVAQQVNYAGPVNLEYAGASSMTTAFEFPSADTIELKNLVLNFEVTSTTPGLTLTRTIHPYNIDFRHGLLFSQHHEVVLRSPVGSPEQGFTRNIKEGGNSHVVGFVRRTLKSGAIIAFGRNEFPVGDFLTYRPLAYQVVDYSSENKSLEHDVLVTYENQRPVGRLGFPIINGVQFGTDIVRYPSFCWKVVSDTPSVFVQGALELTANGYYDFADVGDIRTIYRFGGITDSTGQWYLFGTQYDNYVIQGVPTVTCVNVLGITRNMEMIVTFGLPISIYPPNPLPNLLPLNRTNPEYRRCLTNPALFAGARGKISYSVTSSNPIVASADIVGGDTLLVRLGYATTGFTTIEVKGTDTYDGSSLTARTTVNWIWPMPNVERELFPTEYVLSQNYPNPFNPTTTIEFTLPSEQFVRLSIFNLLGREIAGLMEETLAPGFYKTEWNATNQPSGIYFYRLQAGAFVETKKLILMR